MSEHDLHPINTVVIYSSFANGKDQDRFLRNGLSILITIRFLIFLLSVTLEVLGNHKLHVVMGVKVEVCIDDAVVD